MMEVKSPEGFKRKKMVNFTADTQQLIQVAHGIRGIWNRNPVTSDLCEEFDTILGGYIVQSDTESALRNET